MNIWRYWIVADEVRPARIARTARARLLRLRQVRALRCRQMAAETGETEQEASSLYRIGELIR